LKTAIISDPHSNLEALESVLGFIKSLGCDRIICLGDLVGYGANPDEVTTRVRKEAILVIRGNHDLALLDPREAEDFNVYAREAIFWQRGVMTEENISYLRSLKDQEQIDDIIVAHGSLLDPNEYIFSPFQAARSLEIAPCRITAVGHTHFSEVYRFDPSVGLAKEILAGEGEVELEEGYKYMINPGSVGQPRDGDWRAGFAVYDDEEGGRIKIYRVEYDVQEAAEKIKKVGLPSLLADRLFEGR